jgi:hypothetical protein
MATRRRVWGAAALFCWVVALLLLLAPVHIAGNACDLRPVPGALAGDPDSRCTVRSARRVGVAVIWVVLTAPVTVLFLAQPREPRAVPDE